MRELKEKGIHVCIDSNGGIWNEEVEELFKLTDLVLLDIKEFNPARHQALTGRSNEQTIRTAAWLEENEKPFWLRYVLVPGYSDFEEDIRRLGEALGKYKMVQRVEILPYHTLGVHKYEAMEQEYKLKDVKENTPEQLEKLRRYLKSISLLWWSINHHSNNRIKSPCLCFHLETGTLFDPLPRVNNSIIIGVRTQITVSHHFASG